MTDDISCNWSNSYLLVLIDGMADSRPFMWFYLNWLTCFSYLCLLYDNRIHSSGRYYTRHYFREVQHYGHITHLVYSFWKGFHEVFKLFQVVVRQNAVISSGVGKRPVYCPNTIVIYLSGSRTLFLKFFMGLFTHFVKNFTGISVFYRLRYMFF